MSLLYNTVDYKGFRFHINDNGCLRDPDEFCREWLEYSCEKIGFKPTDRNWKVLEAAHNYYVKTKKIPNVRVVSKATGIPSSEIHGTFPGGFKTVLKLIGHC